MDKFSTSLKADGNINSTIGQTITNQQYFLSAHELNSKMYRYRNKVMTTLLKMTVETILSLPSRNLLCAALDVYDTTDFNALYDVVSSSPSLEMLPQENTVPLLIEIAEKYFTQLISCKEVESSVVQEHKRSFIESISSLQQDDTLELLSTSSEPTGVDVTVKLKAILHLLSDWLGARHDSLFEECDETVLREILHDCIYNTDGTSCKEAIFKELESKLSRYKLHLLADLVVMIRLIIYRIVSNQNTNGPGDRYVKCRDTTSFLIEVILLRMGWLCCRRYHGNGLNGGSGSGNGSGGGNNDAVGDDWLTASNSHPCTIVNRYVFHGSDDEYRANKGGILIKR